MYIAHCDWCGKKIEKVNPIRITWIDRDNYILCNSHFDEYKEITDKIQKRFDSKTATP